MNPEVLFANTRVASFEPPAERYEPRTVGLPADVRGLVKLMGFLGPRRKRQPGVEGGGASCADVVNGVDDGDGDTQLPPVLQVQAEPESELAAAPEPEPVPEPPTGYASSSTMEQSIKKRKTVNDTAPVAPPQLLSPPPPLPPPGLPEEARPQPAQQQPMPEAQAPRRKMGRPKGSGWRQRMQRRQEEAAAARAAAVQTTSSIAPTVSSPPAAAAAVEPEPEGRLTRRRLSLSATATSMASSAIVTVPPQLDSVLPSSSKLSDTHAPSTKRPWTPQLMPVPEEDATPSAQPRHSQRIQKLQNGLASKRLREGGLDSEDQDYFLSSQELTTADGEESTGTTVVMSYADALRPFRSDDLADPVVVTENDFIFVDGNDRALRNCTERPMPPPVFPSLEVTLAIQEIQPVQTPTFRVKESNQNSGAASKGRRMSFVSEDDLTDDESVERRHRKHEIAEKRRKNRDRELYLHELYVRKQEDERREYLELNARIPGMRLFHSFDTLSQGSSSSQSRHNSGASLKNVFKSRSRLTFKNGGSGQLNKSNKAPQVINKTPKVRAPREPSTRSFSVIEFFLVASSSATIRSPAVEFSLPEGLLQKLTK